MNEDNKDILAPADWKQSDAMIKVLGVGGGGCNAVNYMFNNHVQGCSFIVCNTDSQALNACNVPTKIQLGQGLGAGTDPSFARTCALNASEAISEKLFDDKTRMLFITAGMGGGTGTGAAPVIAKMAKEHKILTVAVVTLPFKDEGSEIKSKAVDGIHELEKNVDSLILINNEKLYSCFGHLLIQDAYPKVDEVLSTAVKSILEIIRTEGYVNTDFHDVKNMMSDSGLALMGIGTGNGKNRLEDAVKMAFESPLLNDYDLRTANNALLNITVGNNEKGVTMAEKKELSKLIGSYIGSAKMFKSGLTLSNDPNFGDTVKVTAIVTGFGSNAMLGVEVDKENIIQIDTDFTFSEEDAVKAAAAIPAGRELGAGHIGFNTAENKSRIEYDPQNPPLLLSEDPDTIDKAKDTTAIRRIQK